MEPTAIDLYWIPLGAGDASGCVRRNGRVFEAIVAFAQHRGRRALFHSALVVSTGGRRVTIEMAPEWSGGRGAHGSVCGGPVGLRALGALRSFRYEVRCWADGVIPDLGAALGGPVALTTDPQRTMRLLDSAPRFPTATWGRDEQGLGEMWNSNSLISWLLVSSGHDVADLHPPDGGRAPGWDAGIAAALAVSPPVR